jgi:LuxR family transcriptional regulator, maltose regulon positive regulatory protein
MDIDPLPNHFILQARLNRPKVAADYVARPRLLNLLNAGRDGKLTLVIAPAGFGKTTLVSSWLETLNAIEQTPAAWLSLDEEDGDIYTFLRYFLAALRTIFPDACNETHELLQSVHQPAISPLAATLNNEIERLPHHFVLVLDDLHAPRNQDIADLLGGWLRHWPRPMHLVILSRLQPALPLTELRAKGQLNEIRSRDLRFTTAESAEYLRPTLQTLLDEASLSRLQQRMEGWITGLKLAALSLARHDDPQTFTESLLDDGDFYIADYLVEQVLAQYPPAMQRFLLLTSLTDQFCAPLLAALLDGYNENCDAQLCLNEIEAAGLFVTALDNRREWYRFHDLFRDFLRHKAERDLDEAAIKALHRRAAAWHAQHGLLDQALSHALHANDHNLLSQTIESGLCDTLNHEDRPTLGRWRRLLPENVTRQDPQMLLLEAWETIFHWDFATLAGIVTEADTLLEQNAAVYAPEQERLLRGQFAVFRGVVAHHNNQQAEGAAFCQEALALLPEQWRYARGVAVSYLGLCLHTAGRTEEADTYLAAQYQAEQGLADSYTLRVLLALATNAIRSGHLENAGRAAQIICQKAGESRLAILESWGHLSLGTIYYLRNDLALAERHYGEVVRLRLATFLPLARRGMVGLSLTYQAQGRRAEARHMMEQGSLFDVEMTGREAVETAAARARLSSLQGDDEGAERWVEQFTALPDRPLYPSTEEPFTTRARILIARGRPKDMEAAWQLLDALRDVAERTFNDRAKVEIGALRALAELAQGDAVAAQETLTEAVKAARRGQIIRVFVDLGPRMQKLLYQISGNREVSKTAGLILAAFPEGERGETAVFPHPASAPTEPLTPRELEILFLMAESISLNDIAKRLQISYTTVKRHAINIYAKLNVHSRWEAVASATQNGILPPR